MNALRQQAGSRITQMNAIASVHKNILDERRTLATITHKLTRQAEGDPGITFGSLHEDRVDRFQRRPGLLCADAAGVKLEILPGGPKDTVHAKVQGCNG